MTLLGQVITLCYWLNLAMDQCLLGANGLLGLTVMRGRVEVSMGDGGRDGIPRERCGGGEGELNVSTVTERKIQQPTGEKATVENTCVEGETHLIIPNVLKLKMMTIKENFMLCSSFQGANLSKSHFQHHEKTNTTRC